MNEKMINHIVARYSKFGISFEELKSEAVKIALEAAHSHRKIKGTSLDTWVWKNCHEGLKCYIEKELKWEGHRFCREEDENEGEFVDTFSANQQAIPAFEITQGLSSEAKSICQAIFNAPGEYATLMPKKARGKIVRKLREEGWSWPKIWTTFNEIKSALS